MCESCINEIKHVQNDKLLCEFTHKNHRKKTLGNIDEVEKLAQSAVRKMYITDNIRFSRHLFLEQLNNQFLFFILVQTQSPKNSLICSSLLGKTWSGQVDYPS